jgi:RHS repeat-associated protein
MGTSSKKREAYSTTTESYDSFGRLAAVTEPLGTGVTTRYTYDVGNRLTKVCANSVGTTCTQTRLFTYDNLGLLRAESIPEKATNVTIAGVAGCTNASVCYPSYDAKGHLISRSDAGTALSFAYDRAERLTAVSGSSGVLKSFTFDDTNLHGYSAGKLRQAIARNREGSTEVATVTESYEYLGRGGAPSKKTTRLQWLPAPALDHTFTQTMDVNDLGALERQSYPFRDGVGDPERAAFFAYDQGMLTKVLPYYVEGITYHPSGMVKTITHAKRVTDVQSGASDSRTIASNMMARPDTISATPTSGTQWSSGTYQYDGAGNIKAIGSDTYSYDKVSRLVTSSVADQSGGGTKTQNATYDAYGNIGSFDYDGTSRDRTFSVSASTNRLSSTTGSEGQTTVAYDARGNVTQALEHTFTWDALGQLIRVTKGTAVNDRYAYTADGERILTADAITNKKLITLRGADAKVLREYLISGSTWDYKDYVHAGGQLVTTVSSTSGIRHYHLDHLGSTRLVTDRGGARSKAYTYLPYGLETTAPSAGSPENAEDRLRFTGHERDFHAVDNEMDTFDYFHARTYSAVLGRFLSVDPVRGSAKNPQAWNLVSYSRNAPLIVVDPTGRLVVLAGDRWRALWTIRNAIPAHLRKYVKAKKLKDGRWVLDKRALLLASKTTSTNFANLLSVGISQKVVQVATSIEQCVVREKGGTTRIESFDKDGMSAGLFLPAESTEGGRASSLYLNPFAGAKEKAGTLAHELAHAARYMGGRSDWNEDWEIASSSANSIVLRPAKYLVDAEDEANENWDPFVPPSN